MDGNAAVIDLDFEALWPLPVLVNLIAQYDNGDSQYPADEVKQVTFHLFNVGLTG